MLRSLVGSEMCIRDRDYSAGTITVTPASQTGLSAGIVGCYMKFSNGTRDDYALITAYDGSVITLSHPHYNFCLLYTSDAADDLLCVDLGGRRIIKKKKTQKTTPNTQYTNPPT